jgi:hypothetical protein
MKLISWWGCGKIDQPLISGDKIVEFGIAVLKYCPKSRKQ